MTKARSSADFAAGGFFAGKNKIINGNMNVWQRGTTFTPTATGYFYTTDRWTGYCYSPSTVTISQQAFTPGTAPETGYESQYFIRVNSTNTLNLLQQNIEDVRTLAGQTVTVSFWAKSASAQTLTIYLSQSFGTGGSAGVDNTATKAITTSWARYSVNITLPSVAGKTIGANSFLANTFTGAINNALDIWGVQVEAGSVATPFQTATGTIQGELAACQRYFVRTQDGAIYITQVIGMGSYFTSSQVDVIVNLPVRMRTIPTFSAPTGTNYYRISRNGADDSFNSLTLNSQNGPLACALYNGSEVSGTAGQVGMVQINNTAAYLDFSAEL